MVLYPHDIKAKERIAALEFENKRLQQRLEITSQKYHDSNEHTVEWATCPLSCRADRAVLKEAT